MAELKEGSVILKHTGKELIATLNDVGTKIVISPTEPAGLKPGDWWFQEV